MQEGMPQDVGDLTQGVIATYGPLLYDVKLVFAILATWGITHFLKMSPIVQAIDHENGSRRWVIRFIAVVTGFAAVLFFKRDAENINAVLDLAILIAFGNTALYLLAKRILNRLSPASAEYMSSKK